MCKKAKKLVQALGPLPWLGDCGGYNRPWSGALVSSHFWRKSPLTAGKTVFSAQTPDAAPDATSERDNGKALPRLSQATSVCVTGMQPNFSCSVGAWSPQTFVVSTWPCRSTAVMPRKSFPTGKQYLLWLIYLQDLQTLEGQMMALLWLEIPIHRHYFQYTPALACLLGHDLLSWSAWHLIFQHQVGCPYF